MCWLARVGLLVGTGSADGRWCLTQTLFNGQAKLSGVSDTSDAPTIRTGRRVICHKHGPHKGKRGRVADVLVDGEIAQVEFSATSITAPVTYFEPV